jgi:hypothetical protein
VFRAKQKPLKVPFTGDGDFGTVIDEVSEKTLKGKAIGNNVKSVMISRLTLISIDLIHRYSEQGPGKPYPTQYVRYVPIDGENGKKYEIEFLYRNKSELRALAFLSP